MIKNLLIVSFLIIITASCGYGETFSFVVLADPHIDGDAERKAKFETAINWIINNKADRDIELVFVLGDIAWGRSRDGRNLKISKVMLDRLKDAGIAYIPIIGDNEIQT